MKRDASEARDAACDTGNSFTWRDGSQHPRCCCTSYGEEEKRARLSRHVGVRDAYKGAFMKRVFLSFDGSLSVQLKEPLDCVSRYRKLHKPKTSLRFFFTTMIQRRYATRRITRNGNRLNAKIPIEVNSIVPIFTEMIHSCRVKDKNVNLVFVASDRAYILASVLCFPYNIPVVFTVFFQLDVRSKNKTPH